MSTESSPVHRSTLSMLSVTAAAVFALAACAPDDAITSEEETDQVEDTPDPGAGEETDEPAEDETDDDATEDDEAPEAGGEHPVYQVLETVLGEYPGGVITEFEDEGGYIEVSVYDGSTEWELDVDSETFEILDTEDDGIDADDEEKAQTVEIDIVEALQTAEAEAGADPEESELETEDGTVVWEFEMANDVEVYVDVATGEVVKVDQ